MLFSHLLSICVLRIILICLKFYLIFRCHFFQLLTNPPPLSPPLPPPALPPLPPSLPPTPSSPSPLLLREEATLPPPPCLGPRLPVPGTENARTAAPTTPTSRASSITCGSCTRMPRTPSAATCARPSSRQRWRWGNTCSTTIRSSISEEEEEE